MKRIRIYFEGTTALRAAFGEFLEKALPAAKLNLVAGRGGDQAIDDFVIAYGQPRGERLMLLLDSEEPDDGKLYARLQNKKNWTIPRRANMQGQVCWMVQCMETWFVADRAALRKFYGRKLHEKSLPRARDVEGIPKVDVLKKLKKATGGQYSKGAHAPKILRSLDPQTVKAAAPHCQRLFDTISKQTGV